MNVFLKYAGISLILLLAATPASGNSFFNHFVDPKDGNLDMSQWLFGRTGFLPIPIVISDPAVGYGGGLALAFFHESKDEKLADLGEDGMLTLPPSISFALGAVTENGSWLGGGVFRYLIARRLGLRVGIDIAVGPEDTVVYMGIGSAWH